MAKRRKRKQRRDWDEDEEELGRERRRHSRQWHEARQQGEASRVAVAAAPPRPLNVTCYQCSHLVITRSIVKYINQPWDRARGFPSLSCFEQRWTLDDPDSVANPSEVSEYLVEGADRCPDFARGYPRDHRW
ncbi:MAG: hypothetical protein JO247_22935 [Chloroflexi bacterium]|nr:hypothetical protein [Chloroflexota bacterium]